MEWKKTHQQVDAAKTGARTMSAVELSLDDETRAYARKLFNSRVKGWGDEGKALEDCAGLTGMTPRSFKRLMTGETKQAGSFFSRVRKGYLDYCARKVAELQAEIELEKARYGDVRIGDLGHEVEALAAKIAACRSIKIIDTNG